MAAGARPLLPSVLVAAAVESGPGEGHGGSQVSHLRVEGGVALRQGTGVQRASAIADGLAEERLELDPDARRRLHLVVQEEVAQIGRVGVEVALHVPVVVTGHVEEEPREDPKRSLAGRQDVHGAILLQIQRVVEGHEELKDAALVLGVEAHVKEDACVLLGARGARLLGLQGEAHAAGQGLLPEPEVVLAPVVEAVHRGLRW